MRIAPSILLFAYLPTAVFAADAPKLTQAEQEVFLKTAKVISTRGAKGGITGSLRATLSDGKVTHDAQIQSIDETKARFEGTRGVEINFRDTYKFNIAGYRLGKLLGLPNIPPSVERSYQGHSAAFTWWVDDVLMDEGARLAKKMAAPDSEDWNQQMHILRAFDQLIYNTDRNMGNLLITKDWTIWMIDHTRAFRTSRELLNSKNLVMCDRNLLEAMKKLDATTLRTTMAGMITDMELQGLLQRRDKIVKHFESAGESALYTSTRHPSN
jgi:hypothetical protein